jgi:protein-tyrosine phosphatase
MIPLVDLHCHLLAGLDDGPAGAEEALAMCQIASIDGTRLASATAHQNEQHPGVTPERIRETCRNLAATLRANGVSLTVFPSAEVELDPTTDLRWRRRELLSVADRGEYLLIELPHGSVIDARDTLRSVCRGGVRPILAHPERCPELLHEAGRIEELIELGCLVQVSSSSVTEPASGRDARALRGWFRRGIVHVLGSDGHSAFTRPPRMADAYERIRRWAGAPVADRVCSTSGMAILNGLPLRIARPEPAERRWFVPFW